MTNSLKRRIHEHKNLLNDGFTKKYHTNRLVYFETFLRLGDAIEREKQIKKGSRAKKLLLVESFNKGWEDLSSLL
ncbi:MAG: GIY-YIG nuclease family protein [bacterium]